MTDTSEQTDKGKKLLQEVALRYASQHGLRPDKIEWVNQGYEWLLRVSTDEHTVRVGFSMDEIRCFAEGNPEENKGTKVKIRNAFASLSM